MKGETRERHVPVLRQNIVDELASQNAVLVDGTLGDGGHAEALLEESGERARLLGIDLDAEAISRAGIRLKRFGDRVRIIHETFAHIAEVTDREGFHNVTGVLFDLGMSTWHLEAERGFSFQKISPLDMRFDAGGSITLPEPEHPAVRRIAKRTPSYKAEDVLYMLSEQELADIFYEYGGERHARRIARRIVSTRKSDPIRTTRDLSMRIVSSLPRSARHGRIHAATRVFQALRMVVNRETETLMAGIDGALRILVPGGKLVIISFHEGEDRIVKHRFREVASTDMFTVLTKRPITSSEEERSVNPWSRSAKLRIIQRTHSKT